VKPSVRFGREAQAEFAQAFRWYDAQRPGLGDELLLDVAAAIRDIESWPHAHRVVHREFRRALLRRFPYGLF
jgi:hypothetical protein